MSTLTHTSTKVPTMGDHLRALESKPGRKGSLTSEEVAALLSYGATHVRAADEADTKVAQATTAAEEARAVIDASRESIRKGVRAANENRAIVARVVFVVTSQGPTGVGVRTAADLGISQGEVSKYKAIGGAMASARQTSGGAYAVLRAAYASPKRPDLPSGADALKAIVTAAQASALASTTGETPKAGVRASVEDLSTAAAEVLPPAPTAPVEPSVLKVTTVTNALKSMSERVTAATKAHTFVGTTDDMRYAVDAARAILATLEGSKPLPK
jgi:hypothetical protein